jgi:hypothetical protein
MIRANEYNFGVNGEVGITPVAVGAGVQIGKKNNMQGEDIVHKNIQETGWTRVDRGCYQTFYYDKVHWFIKQRLRSNARSFLELPHNTCNN